MATRRKVFETLETATGQSYEFWANSARMLKDSPAPHGTALGQGLHNAHCGLEWTCSTFLAGVIGEPKNVAVKVPQYAALKGSASRRIRKRTAYEWSGKAGYNTLLPFVGPATTTIEDAPLGGPDDGWTGTFFSDFLGLVDEVARTDDAVARKALVTGLEIVIHLGRGPMVEWTEPLGADQTNLWMVTYTSSTEDIAPIPALPIKGQVTLTGPYILMLAALWADTIRHTEKADPTSEPPKAAGGGENTKQSATLKKTKAAGAPPPTTSVTFNRNPLTTQQASEFEQPAYTLSHTPEEEAGEPDKVEWQRDHLFIPSPETSRHGFREQRPS